MVDLDSAFRGALTRCDSVGFDKLTSSEQVLVAIWWLEADVNNGGFDQYLYNSGGDYAFFVTGALRTVGAHAAAAIVSRVVRSFGEGGVPRDRGERQSALAAMAEAVEHPFESEDQEFWAYPDDIQAMVRRYLASDGRLAD